MSRLSGSVLASLDAQVLCVASLPHSGRVVNASDDGYVTMWESKTMIWRKDHADVTTVAVSPAGTQVVCGTLHGDLQLRDADSGVSHSDPLRLHNDRVWSVCWSPDGERIASCSADDTFIIWKPSTGEVIHRSLQTRHGVVRAIAYCPKGGSRVVTSGHDSTIRIWDDTTGVLQVTLPIQTEAVLSSESTIPSVSWTTDGNKIISGSVDGNVRMWDVLQRKMLWEVPAHDDAIHHIAVSEHVFATTSADNTIKLWNLETHCLVGLSSFIDDHDEARCIALTADENSLVAGTKNGKIYTFDIGDIVSGMKTVSPRII